MKFLSILFILSNFLFAQNVLIINSYSSIFPWTKSQSDAIINGLQKNDDINIFVEFMDTKKIHTYQTSKR